MSSFSLRIIASDHIFYDGSCEILTVPAHDGPVSILAHHEAVIMATQEGEVWFRAAGNTEWQEAIVGIGIVQVVNNRALVIVDSAERPEEMRRRPWRGRKSKCVRSRVFRSSRCLRRLWPERCPV